MSIKRGDEVILNMDKLVEDVDFPHLQSISRVNGSLKCYKVHYKLPFRLLKLEGVNGLVHSELFRKVVKMDNLEKGTILFNWKTKKDYARVLTFVDDLVFIESLGADNTVSFHTADGLINAGWKTLDMEVHGLFA